MNVLDVLDLQGLTGEQKKFLHDYVYPVTTFRYKETPEKRAVFALKYLKKPKSYVPTDLAMRCAYAILVLHRLLGHEVKNISEVEKADIDFRRIRNVSIDTEYQTVSRISQPIPILIINAEVRISSRHGWESDSFRRVHFNLQEWVERKT